MPRRRMVDAVVVALLTLATAMAVTGCRADKDKTARETFAKDRSCPLDAVRATVQPGVSSYDLTFGKPTPPAEAASDPQRLALWQADQARERAGWDAKVTVYLLVGCKETKYYGCGGAKNGTYCAAMTAPVP